MVIMASILGVCGILCNVWPPVRLVLSFVKHQPHENDNLDERIVTISCKRVHGATQARPAKRVFVRSQGAQ